MLTVCFPLAPIPFSGRHCAHLRWTRSLTSLEPGSTSCRTRSTRSIPPYWRHAPGVDPILYFYEDFLGRIRSGSEEEAWRILHARSRRAHYGRRHRPRTSRRVEDTRPSRPRGLLARPRPAAPAPFSSPLPPRQPRPQRPPGERVRFGTRLRPWLNACTAWNCWSVPTRWRITACFAS